MIGMYIDKLEIKEKESWCEIIILRNSKHSKKSNIMTSPQAVQQFVDILKL